VHEHLRIVLSEETEARRRVDAARQEAKRLVEEAEETGRQRVSAARGQQEQIAADAAATLVAAAHAHAETLAAMVRERIPALQQQAESHLDEAVEAVVERLLSKVEAHGR
jgi:vacuolar-type H+-ATPase subunit H